MRSQLIRSGFLHHAGAHFIASLVFGAALALGVSCDFSLGKDDDGDSAPTAEEVAAAVSAYATAYGTAYVSSVSGTQVSGAVFAPERANGGTFVLLDYADAASGYLMTGSVRTTKTTAGTTVTTTFAGTVSLDKGPVDELEFAYTVVFDLCAVGFTVTGAVEADGKSYGAASFEASLGPTGLAVLKGQWNDWNFVHGTEYLIFCGDGTLRHEGETTDFGTGATTFFARKGTLSYSAEGKRATMRYTHATQSGSGPVSSAGPSLTQLTNPQEYAGEYSLYGGMPIFAVSFCTAVLRRDGVGTDETGTWKDTQNIEENNWSDGQFRKFTVARTLTIADNGVGGYICRASQTRTVIEGPAFTQAWTNDVPITATVGSSSGTVSYGTDDYQYSLNGDTLIWSWNGDLFGQSSAAPFSGHLTSLRHVQ